MAIFLVLGLTGQSLAAILLPPGGITIPANDVDGSYVVKWTKSPTATTGITYELQEATNATFTLGVRTVPHTTVLSASIAGRSTGKTYYYRVRAIKTGWATSDYLAGSHGCLVKFLAGTPGTISVPQNDADGSYVVTWTASATPGVTYVLQEATNSNFTTGRRTVPHGALLSANISGRTPGTYYYRVYAKKVGYQNSSWKIGDNACVVSKTNSADEIAIQSLYFQLKSAVEAKDVDDFLALFSPDYIHDGRGILTLPSRVGDMQDFSSVNYNISSVDISGNNAVVHGVVTLLFNDGGSVSFTEPDVTAHSLGFGWLQRTVDGWRFIGNQLRHFSDVNIERVIGLRCVKFANPDRFAIEANIYDQDGVVQSATLDGDFFVDPSVFSYNRYTPGEWALEQNVVIAQGSPPSFPLNYTISIEYKDGTTQEVDLSVNEFENAQ